MLLWTGLPKYDQLRARINVPLLAGTFRTTRRCAQCHTLITVAGNPITAMAQPLYCLECSPGGHYGPARPQ